MIKARLILAGALLLCLLPAWAAAAEVSSSPFAQALKLFEAGEYSDARGMVRRLIEDYEAGAIRMQPAEMASVYLLDACLADIFREGGFAEMIDTLVATSLSLDPNVSEELAVERPYVRQRLREARTVLLQRHSPATRRYSAGLLLSASGPASLRYPDAVLPGIRLAFSPLAWLAIEAESSLPLSGSPPLGVELRLGASFRPLFELERLTPAFGLAYVASSGPTWSHGAAFSVGAELTTRADFSFRGTVELLRLDATKPPAPSPGAYPAVGGASVVAAFSFPRVTLCAAYSF